MSRLSFVFPESSIGCGRGMVMVDGKADDIPFLLLLTWWTGCEDVTYLSQTKLE